MRNLWSPASFQGRNKKRRYFEGWYFKHSGGTGEGVWSFIPGISLGDKPGSGYAFVQAIEGRIGRSWWFQYPAEEFHAAESGLDIRVGKNRFTDKGIELDLSDGVSRISGAFAYGPFSIMKFPFWSPGVMGPFSFAPKMECNHGLVSLDHSVDGQVEIDGHRVSIVDGRGYIEKDWGHSMPESWIWTQSNDFPVSRRFGDAVGGEDTLARIVLQGAFSARSRTEAKNACSPPTTDRGSRLCPSPTTGLPARSPAAGKPPANRSKSA